MADTEGDAGPATSGDGADGDGADGDGASGATPAVAAAQLRFTVGGVARLLGVAPSTLRTWDRRYGLGPSGRSQGRHRRYGELDVARLALMRQLTLRGVPPADAAGVAVATPAAQLRIPHRHLTGGPDQLPAQGTGQATAPTQPLYRPTGDGDGDGDGASPTRQLAEAVADMDVDRVTALVLDSMSRRGVVASWDELIGPVLHTACRGSRHDADGVAAEFLFLEIVARELAHRAAGGHSGAPGTGRRPVVLAGTLAEPHVLPLYAVAAALAERQVSVRVLGARVPRSALAEAVERLGAGAVCLWSQASDTAQADAVALSGPREGAPALVLAGPGWGCGPEVASARRAGDLAGVVRLLGELAA